LRHIKALREEYPSPPASEKEEKAKELRVADLVERGLFQEYSLHDAAKKMHKQSVSKLLKGPIEPANVDD